MQLCNLWNSGSLDPPYTLLLPPSPWITDHGPRLLMDSSLLRPTPGATPLLSASQSLGHVEARLYSLGLPCSLPSDPIRLRPHHNKNSSLPCRATYTCSLAGKLHWFFFSSLPDTHIETGSTPTAWVQPSYYSTPPSLSHHTFDKHHANRTRPQRPGT